MYILTREFEPDDITECDNDELLAFVEDKDLEKAIEWYSKAITKADNRNNPIKRTDWNDLDKVHKNNKNFRLLKPEKFWECPFWLGYKRIKKDWTPETGPVYENDRYRLVMEEE